MAWVNLHTPFSKYGSQKTQGMTVSPSCLQYLQIAAKTFTLCYQHMRDVPRSLIACSNHKAAFKQKEAPNAQSNKEAGEAIAFKFHNAVANVSLLLLIHVPSLLIALDL